MLHDGVELRAARDPVVVHAGPIGKDQLGEGIVRRVAGEVDLIVDVAAAQLVGGGIARPMGAADDDRDDVRHDQIRLLEREEPGSQVHRIAAPHTAQDGCEEVFDRAEDVAGHAPEVDTRIRHDLPAVRAHRAPTVCVPAALPRAVAPQRDARARWQAVDVRHNHADADRARCAVRPEDQGAVGLGGEDERRAHGSRNGCAIVRDARDRQRAQRPGGRLQNDVGRNANLQIRNARRRRHDLVRRRHRDFRRVLRVDERHPHCERQHRGLAGGQWQTVVERPVCLSRCVCRRTIHDQDLVPVADLAEQEAAGIVGQRRSAADPQRDVREGLAVEAEHLA